MSSYTGLYVQRLNGVIHSVQVKDSAGHSLSLKPQDYIDREIKPPINSLPDIAEYFTTPPEKPELSPRIYDLARWVKGEILPEELLRILLQMGFIFLNPVTGELELTPSGRQTLVEFGFIL